MNYKLIELQDGAWKLSIFHDASQTSWTRTFAKYLDALRVVQGLQFHLNRTDTILIKKAI